MNYQNDPLELSEEIAFNACLNLSNQIISLSTSNGKVKEKFSQYKMIKSALEYLACHYHGSALNDYLSSISESFDKLETTILQDNAKYTELYGKGSSDGYI